MENGWTVSVQFGAGNYCERRDADYKAAKRNDFWESNSAEIAAWFGDRNGLGTDNWYKFLNLDPTGETIVKGYCSPNEVVEFLGVVATLAPR
jgi:hypothetical protein